MHIYMFEIGSPAPMLISQSRTLNGDGMYMMFSRPGLQSSEKQTVIHTHAVLLSGA